MSTSTCPPPALAAARYELGLWRALIRWITRRPATADSFGYVAPMRPMLVVFLVLSVVEVVVAHLLLPWPAVRLAVDVLGGIGLLWMVCLLAALTVNRHEVTEDGLRSRYGVTVDVVVPWAEIDTVRLRRYSLETNRTVQTVAEGDRQVTSVAVVQSTNVAVLLRRPTRLGLPGRGNDGPVHELRLYADDAEGMVARALDRLGR